MMRVNSFVMPAIFVVIALLFAEAGRAASADDVRTAILAFGVGLAAGAVMVVMIRRDGERRRRRAQ